MGDWVAFMEMKIPFIGPEEDTQKVGASLEPKQESWQPVQWATENRCKLEAIKRKAGNQSGRLWINKGEVFQICIKESLEQRLARLETNQAWIDSFRFKNVKKDLVILTDAK